MARSETWTTAPILEGRRIASPLALIQIQIWLLFLIPPYFRIGPLGEVGNPATLFALLLFVMWATTVLASSLSVRRRSGPVRLLLAVLWLATLLSYGAMHRHGVAADVAASADRFLIQMAAFSGLALYVAEGVASMDDLMVVVRTFVAGVATMAAVAIVQSRLGFDPVRYVARIPGLTTYREVTDVFSREGINRPSGTAGHPIEFGCVAGIGLAFAIHVAIYDRVWSRAARVGAVGLIALGIPAAVSRSALLVAGAVLIVFLVGTTRAIRARTIPWIALVTGVVFVTFPGLLGTLKGLITIGSADSSITTRTDDYAFVDPLIKAHAWLGMGPGSFLPRIRILDNQYLLTTVEMGLIGLTALILVLAATAVLGNGGRKRLDDEGSRFLGLMFIGAGVGILLATVTFDAFSFQMFTAVVALMLGMSGAYRTMGVDAERRRTKGAPQLDPGVSPSGP